VKTPADNYIERVKKERQDLIPDCGDNSCDFKGRGSGGMRTNGGCRCVRQRTPDAARYIRMLHERYKEELK
jgi:hypothetical protein